MKLFTATNVSVVLAAAGAIVVIAMVAQYGTGRHPANLEFRPEIGGLCALLVANVGLIIGLFAIRKKVGRPRRVAQAAVLANLAVFVGVFATGLCG